MKKIAFKVGDAVFYPGAGVGMIEGVEDVFLGARSERCFVIRIHENHITIKVPQSNLENTRIRPLLNGRKLKELFKLLGTKAEQRPSPSNWSEYYKDIERKINNGSSFDLGEVVRDLTWLKRENGLSFDEARLLETARDFLTHEIALIEGIPAGQAADRIRASIG